MHHNVDHCCYRRSSQSSHPVASTSFLPEATTVLVPILIFSLPFFISLPLCIYTTEGLISKTKKQTKIYVNKERAMLLIVVEDWEENRWSLGWELLGAPSWWANSPVSPGGYRVGHVSGGMWPRSSELLGEAGIWAMSEQDKSQVCLCGGTIWASFPPCLVIFSSCVQRVHPILRSWERMNRKFIFADFTSLKCLYSYLLIDFLGMEFLIGSYFWLAILKSASYHRNGTSSREVVVMQRSLECPLSSFSHWWHLGKQEVAME